MNWRICRPVLLTATLLPALLSAQELHLKTRTISPREFRSKGTAVHRIARFDHSPSVEDLNALMAAGAHILAAVPDNAVMISARVGIALPGVIAEHELETADKLSPSLAGAGDLLAIVEFHADVSRQTQDAVAAAEGLTFQRPAVLVAAHAIVSASLAQLTALAAHDEVAYIFPADPALLNEGAPEGSMMPCTGMLTLSGPIAQYANIVHGWTPDAGAMTHLNYTFGALISAKQPDDEVKAAVIQALNQWSAWINLVFQPGVDPNAARTVLIKFASGAHGDAYPFDSTSGVLAHTFYPVPVNGEPIAGDMHLNADMTWNLGGDIDVYSVALHEAGHALGLGHSDNPGDVMYPYYRRGMPLSANDIGAAQTLYGTPGTTPIPSSPAPTIPAPTVPLSLTLNPILPPGTAAQTPAGGTISGGVAPITVQWQTSSGASGNATVAATGFWNVAAIPLAPGSNTITITAFDSADKPVTQSAIVVRTAPAAISAPVSISITTPAGTLTTVGTASISLAGKASSGAGVSQVVWQTNAGASGTANGVGPWSAPNIPLLVGTNTIIVRAFDANGTSAWASIMVVRH